jgi:hypothetical protein
MWKKVIYRSVIMLMVISLAGGMGACKSKKKLAKEKEAAEYAAKLETAKTTLMDILNDNTAMSLDEKEAAVQAIRDMNLNDPEVDELLAQADEKLAAERAAWNKKAMEDKQKATEGTVVKEKAAMTLTEYFSSIASAGSVSQANVLIADALKLFSSPEAPVLIIISKQGATVDYDRPTTIKNYLNYLKDTRNNVNKVDKIIYDDYGKIKELELLKTY